MPVPLLDTFLFKLIYPAALTAFGVRTNAYILRREMKEVKGVLRESQIKEVASDMKELASDMKQLPSEVKELANNIKYLSRLQAAFEVHDKAMAENFFQDCV